MCVCVCVCVCVCMLQESFLNGRLEACGHVDGFVAELAASGSFCPPHLTLPVTAAFYSLHDNYRGTSPYLVILMHLVVRGVSDGIPYWTSSPGSYDV